MMKEIYSRKALKSNTVKDSFEDDELVEVENDDDESLEYPDVRGTIFDPFTDADDEEGDDDDDDDGKIPDWNLITAFNEVLDASRHMRGTLGHGKIGSSAMDYLMEQLDMTFMQVIIIAMLIENGQAMTWNDMAHFLGTTRLTMMTHTEEIEELMDKRRWLQHTWIRRHGGKSESFKLVFGVIKAIRHNEVFVPEDLSNLTEQSFAERVAKRINEGMHDPNREFEEDEKWLMYLVNQNMHLPLARVAQSSGDDIHNKCLLLMFVADYMEYANADNDGLTMDTIDRTFPSDWDCCGMRSSLAEGKHELQESGWIEFKCDDGIANTGQFVFTQKAKDELLSEVKPLSVMPSPQHNSDRDLISFKDIHAKNLFYNSKEKKQIDRLRGILSQEQLPQIQQRLADKGMRTGIAVLLSGGPGTGKTETVRQLALETGRDLLMIDISQVKDKFVGESEKNTKAIFDRYKRLCKDAEVKPILFINECDAILGKRMENTEHSADKMQNSMQNILLQALEDLDGVVICTTNLAQSLDSAFERRFLMKVEFDKPDTDVRAHIWQSMIPSLTDDDAHTLAERYSFSGGQCENVMRKATIEQIINGTEPSLAQLDSFCKEENALQKNRIRPITGFAA